MVSQLDKHSTGGGADTCYQGKYHAPEGAHLCLQTHVLESCLSGSSYDDDVVQVFDFRKERKEQRKREMRIFPTDFRSTQTVWVFSLLQTYMSDESVIRHKNVNISIGFLITAELFPARGIPVWDIESKDRMEFNSPADE